MHIFEQQLVIRILKALANPNRFYVISLLRDETLTVGQIVEKSGLEQSLVSHILKYLEVNRFVISKQKGKYVHYCLNKKTVVPILRKIDEHISLYAFESILNHAHKQTCRACIDIPNMIMAKEDVSNYSVAHTCGCSACISNIDAILKKRKLSAYRPDHTCGCSACMENQYFTLKYVNR